jgi:8-oxo-dGTP pyrophosphatase MutT (NUDIX family)
MRILAESPSGFDPSRPWEELRHELRGRSRLFDQFSSFRRSPHTAREHEFTRLHCPEWVNVIAFTATSELLVVEQFRHGIDASTLEIVGGVCDPGEDPAVSGRRELLEETGHIPDKWIPLGSCSPNPAIQDNHCHFFLALDCQPVGELKLDRCEELRLWAVPWAEWEDKLRNGEIHHALVLAAFLRLFCWEGWPALKGELESRTKGD